MKVKGTLNSIRGKIVLIYCLLVFIATTIIGVFIMSQLEAYYINSTKDNLSKAVQEGSLLISLNSYEDIDKHKEEIQESIDAWSKSLQQEIFVVNESFMIIAASNETKGKSAIDILDQGLILQGLGGGSTEKTGYINSQTARIPTISMVFPVGGNKDARGVLYLRADLTSVYNTINQSKEIFLKAMIIALAITAALGFFIAKSITEPINNVTKLAKKMADGDFSQEVSIKSNDEIGRLAEMFNILRLKLNETLTEISNEKSKLETILKYMADGLIAVDLSGHIVHANPSAMAMLKVSKQEIEERNYDDIIKEINPRLTIKETIEKCKLAPVEENFEFGGSNYAVRYDHFRDENGSDVGIIMILQDITQRQKVEKMQMDFVANVSHELKTPLTTIKSYTETLIDGAVEDPETEKSFLEIINMEADRMNRLVKDLLQLSRLDHQQEKLVKKNCDLTKLLLNAVKKVELTANGKKQHLNCLFDSEKRILIIGDKDSIEQVLLNVLSNSIKYTQVGGRIDIDAIIHDKKVAITVADNGIGIPKAELSRVFERFFRVDKARSRAMGGTGLGLAISKQIVEEHDGVIKLESKEGIGTTVFITLSLAASRGESNID
ncbi:MAG: HAMP domain-containing protein [Peptostreptococcaceae bacterium]|nr:HAMP domain-containing protein [Peptostreptococcaceae bacterium]